MSPIKTDVSKSVSDCSPKVREMGGRVVTSWIHSLVAGAAVGVAGCGLPAGVSHEQRLPLPTSLQHAARPQNEIKPVAHSEAAALPVPLAPVGPTKVDDLVAVAVARNPRLAKATFAIDAAHGRYIQAGLYPNPNLAIDLDELGDRTGPAGIVSLPKLSQTFITGRKLSLAQAVVFAEVNQATLALFGERYAVVSSVRAAFYDLYALERRIEVLSELVRLAEEAVKNGKNLLDNQKIARLDLVQLEVERERFRADLEAAQREVPSARRRLAALIGDSKMPIGEPTGTFEVLPEYDQDQAIELVQATHPEARSARVGVERAQAALRRARVEPIPDVNLYTSFVIQNQNKSNDFSIGFSGAIPVWNRNQGAIRAAQAELGMALQEAASVENDLADRVATAFRAYASARRLAELYRTEILPRATETFELSLKAFQGGQFEYLRVIAAQRAVAEARLSYNKALAEAWKGAAQLSGLLLEEAWPDKPAAQGPKDEPVPLPIPPTGKPGP